MTYTKQPLDLITRLRMSYAGKYRPLQVEAADAIEALQAECAEHKENAMRNARIAVSIRAERDQLQAKLGDAIQSSAHWQHQCTELQAENERLKRELEISKLDVKEWHSQADALQSQLDAMGKVEPVQFLANGARFKLVNCGPNASGFVGFPKALAGRWVALVAAENDCHLNLAAPKALAPLTDEQKNSAWDDHWSNPSIPSTACSAFYAGMRFAEKHHGIGGTP